MDPVSDAVKDASLHRPGGVRRWIQPTAGYAIALACLVWVFHDIRVEGLFQNIKTIRWGFVALAILLDVLNYVAQGWRWTLLLVPVGRPSVLRSTQAIYVGLFTNEVLPMRFGELVRAYLVSRWIRVPLTAVVPSMMVERWLDGVWMALAIGLTAILIPLPRNLLEAGDALGVIVLIATVLFVLIVLRSQRADLKPRDEKSEGPGLWRRAGSVVTGLARGLKAIGLSRPFYLAAMVSLFMLGIQAMSFWLVMWAYGLPLSLWVGAAVFLIVHLGTALPNAPANVGTYQFFTVVGLTLFGVDKTLATGFSVVVFVLLTFPLWILGFVALSQSGTTLLAIRKEIARLRLGMN
ncbi:MAG: flippase-like domain-containing protein [Acidobacteriia bacterium]|nr:flippase-like domain-containing protein [Terriglobia bacterium]